MNENFTTGDRDSGCPGSVFRFQDYGGGIKWMGDLASYSILVSEYT
jgi:hypothetical protein